MDIEKNTEVFKQIKNYPNYMISNKGRIYNNKTCRYIKATIKENGYCQVNLIDATGKRKHEYVHRLVGLTFIDNPNKLPQIDHIDRDRTNNVVENLRWVSIKENNRNRVNNHHIKVYQDNVLLCEFNSVVEMAEAFNCSASYIYGYLNGSHKSGFLNNYTLV